MAPTAEARSQPGADGGGGGGGGPLGASGGLWGPPGERGVLQRGKPGAQNNLAPEAR